MLRGTGLSRAKSRTECRSHSSWLHAPRCPCPACLLHLTDRKQTSGWSTLHDEEGVQKEVRCQQGAASSHLPPGSSLSLKGSSTSMLLALASLSQLGIT